MLYRYLWNPLKWAGKKLDFLSIQRILYVFVPFYLVGLYAVYHKSLIDQSFQRYLPFVFATISLVMVLKGFTERKHTRLSWVLVIMSHFWIALAVSFNENFTFEQIHIYLSGVSLSGVIGLLCLRRLKNFEGDIDLYQFHGHSYKHPKIAIVFLLACLGASGFPITPTFIGEDLIFSHIRADQLMLALFIALSFIVSGIAIIRLYARVFLGPNAKSVYEMAYRST
jgi:formate hydrogenlyase subunit 3/multisubunit Na+/H+ antiporter MnhD subunit